MGAARKHAVVAGGERRGCEITEAMIARRACELSLTDDRSTPEENWERAERELREEAADRD